MMVPGPILVTIQRPVVLCTLMVPMDGLILVSDKDHIERVSYLAMVKLQRACCSYLWKLNLLYLHSRLIPLVCSILYMLLCT
jgi:hypothetical protein